jgi:hypothetical protein
LQNCGQRATESTRLTCAEHPSSRPQPALVTRYQQRKQTIAQQETKNQQTNEYNPRSPSICPFGWHHHDFPCCSIGISWRRLIFSGVKSCVPCRLHYRSPSKFESFASAPTVGWT